MLTPPFAQGSGRMARLVNYLFLYRKGFDFRGLLVLDEYIRKDIVALREAVNSVFQTKNLTLWLEYYLQGMVIQLTKAYETESSHTTDPYFSGLNERQKKILYKLQEWGALRIRENPFEYYGVDQSFKVTYLWCLDLVKWGRFGYWIEMLTFAERTVWHVLFKKGTFK